MNDLKDLEEDLEEKVKKLCFLAIELTKNYKDAKTFYLQTHFNKKFLALVDNFEDIKIEKGFAFKNIINKKALEIFSKNTNLVLDQKNHQLLISLNFSSESVSVKRNNIYIFANYLKKSREYAQHFWPCQSCKGRGCKTCNYTKEKYPSLESVFRKVFVDAFKASDCYFHAAGREDIDVLTLGNGRPCVIEVVNPTIANIDLEKLSNSIKQNYPIELLNPKYVQKFWVEVVCNSHFNKKYYAIISSEKRKLTLDDFKKLKNSLPILLKQRTPIRVLKRRADIIRKRFILDLKLDKIENGMLHVFIYAEAGTYIKEFISGDGGRTNPSVCSILNTPCVCQKLDLIKVEDFFLKTIKD
ncbi:MAG: tRNA pseudouridine(54/55) synthase Pus10 [Candidatus Omnitrophica bacterium]|nr:tRNA pseudouridine(54/55) synthase Pus10 [Candidatus Omnitrophota bacterium]